MDNIRGEEKVEIGRLYQFEKMMCNNNGWRGIRNMERTERRAAERPIVFATRVLSNTRHKHK